MLIERVIDLREGVNIGVEVIIRMLLLIDIDKASSIGFELTRSNKVL